jgi:demethylmenaquinone methyltransferase/2-methoxy-6-polyprenyl-1,4-benzoquinol methylase
MRALNNLYLRWWVQPIGGIMSGEKSAYSYLMETIEDFSTPEALSDMLENAGFSTVSVHLVMFQSVQMIYAIK